LIPSEEAWSTRLAIIQPKNLTYLYSKDIVDTFQKHYANIANT